MKNTRLIQLLKSFSQNEFKQFRDFAASPYFNKNKNSLALLNYLGKFYPEFNDKKTEEEFVFGKLFPDEKYDYFKLKNIISDLLALGKEFLAINRFKNDNDGKVKLMLEEFRVRELDSLFENLHKSTVKKINESPVKDEFYFYKQLDLTDELKSYISPKEPNSHFNLFQDQLDYFLKYALIRLLRIYNTMLHEYKQNNYVFDMKLYEQIFDYLENNKNENNPTILLYYYIIKLETGQDENYFFELKELVSKQFDSFSHYDKYMYFLHMAGFCADIFNKKGRKDFMKEHFLLSKENFDTGTIELGKILYMDFMNHVKIAVRVNEFEWAENYINTFKDKLIEERENSLNFCYGYINYKKGNLDKALDFFSKANLPDHLIKVQVKMYLLQIYYEKKFYEQALSMIDTFRHYIAREKSIKGDIKESFQEFLKITNELIKMQTNGSANKNFERNKIKASIEQMSLNYFGTKLWLKDMIDLPLKA